MWNPPKFGGKTPSLKVYIPIFLASTRVKDFGNTETIREKNNSNGLFVHVPYVMAIWMDPLQQNYPYSPSPFLLESSFPIRHGFS